MKIASLTAASLLAILAFACSSTKTEYISAPTDGGKDSGITKKDSGTEEEEDETKKDAGDEVEQTTCADETTAASCGQCCQTEHEKGSTTYLTALLECACQADVCATACKTTYCAATPKNADAACEECIDGEAFGTACEAPIQTACEADADCVALIQCAQPCASIK